MLRMRIRHLMILVLYFAIAMAALVAVLRTPASGRVAAWFGLGFGLPLTFAGLSRILLGPGPHRDWIVAFFLVMTWVLAASLFAAPLFVLAFLHVARPSEWNAGVLFQSAIYALFFGIVAITFATRRLIPTFCPRCGRRAVVGASGQEQLHRGQFLYFRCWVCDRVSRLEIVEIAVATGRGWSRFREKHLVSPLSWRVPAENRPACPACGRKALREVPYRFCWCLACGSRYKRARRQVWEDAGTPDDDAFYYL
jgi:hypothetical protein